MKFNRNDFFIETNNDVKVAIKCIEELVEAIDGHACGCYGKGAKDQFMAALKNKQVGKFLDK